MNKIILYGIPNCDTTKKTMAWFKRHQILFEFHDYKQAGISKDKLSAWIKEAGLETILNKRSTTWRELPAKEQQQASSVEGAIQLMVKNTSLIKRPVVESASRILVGYDEPAFVKYLSV